MVFLNSFLEEKYIFFIFEKVCHTFEKLMTKLLIKKWSSSASDFTCASIFKLTINKIGDQKQINVWFNALKKLDCWEMNRSSSVTDNHKL